MIAMVVTFLQLLVMFLGRLGRAIFLLDALIDRWLILSARIIMS
jgi:hypothetical protein